MMWRMVSVALALAVVGTGVVLSAPGCDEVGVAPDAGFVPPDVGAGRACGDVGPFGWNPQVQSAAVLDDAGASSTLYGVWGASSSAIWAVGTHGMILFYDGSGWQRQQAPTEVDLTSVWGTSDKDVWAVGYEGTALHFDGTSWSDMSPPLAVFHTADGGVPSGDAAVGLRRNLWGVWATGAQTTEALYAVGDQGTVVYFDGKQKLWSDKIPVTAAGSPVKIQDQLNAVWGTGANKVYIVGNFGTILQGSKNGLAMQQTGTTKDLHAIWGRGDNDIYAVGTGGTVLHRSGGGWKAVAGAPNQVLRGVWGPANPSTVYISGWDGTLLRLSGGPGFGQGAEFVSYYCITPMHRLEGMWGTMVPITELDAGTVQPVVGDASAPDLSPVDSGIPNVPLMWVVGASGMVVAGP